MALFTQPSFSSGELDPALHERTGLQKYRSSLATARNVAVGKTGRLVSLPGRKHIVTLAATTKVKIHPLPHLGLFIEWGHLIARLRFMADGGAQSGASIAHAFTSDQLDDIRFVDVSIGVVAVFCKGESTLFLTHADSTGATVALSFTANPFGRPALPTYLSSSYGGTGYSVNYRVTYVQNGQESAPSATLTGSPLLPITSATMNDFSVQVPNPPTGVTEIRVYRRPALLGAFGYIGSSTNISGAGAASFRDYGQDADYTHGPPELTPGIRDNLFSDPLSFESVAGAMYQQRLLMSYGASIEASRTEFPYNFYRDFPLSAESALSIKILSSGNIARNKILYFVEAEGLVVFCTLGVWVSVGALGPSNLGLENRGAWVIDRKVPPLKIPGGVLFIDSLTNTVRALNFSTEAGTYIADEVSVFSDHLFLGKQVASWAFQDGPVPLLWVVFTDGTGATFTYQREQEMKAWTRVDSFTDIEYVASFNQTEAEVFSTTGLNGILFVVNNDDVRSVEFSLPRYVSPSENIDNPEADKGPVIAAMDSVVTSNGLFLDEFDVLIPFTLAVIDEDDDDEEDLDEEDYSEPNLNEWEENLTLNCGAAGIFTVGSYGAVGTVFRHFHPIDRTVVDLTVVSRTSDNEVVVRPSARFDEDYASGPRLYATLATFDGLDHMEGEDVSVIVDGNVVASPNNDDQNYATLTVSQGEITLPNDMRGAIVHIGRPRTSDIETLSIDTVEQRPVHNESGTTNKVYIKTHNSRGLYVANKFPADDKVAGMQALDSYVIDYADDDPILANRYDQPQSRKYEVTTPGDWQGNGKVCIRQVDPIHFEILSIVSDLEDLRR